MPSGTTKTAYDMAEPEFDWVEGGVCAPVGIKASGVHAGFRKNASKRDLALVKADEPCASAAVFTRNEFCAAPVTYSKDRFVRSSGSSSWGCAQVIAINSGNANAATGSVGLERCCEEADLVAEATGVDPSEVLIASTGVIGVQLPLGPFEEGLPEAVSALSRDGGDDAAHAIMTTDTFAKQCAVEFDGDGIGFEGCTFKVGGMAKGSGMIMPDMATMIAVITTDAPIEASHLYEALKSSADVSFNKVTVDSDTSTNDTCFALATGGAVRKAVREGEGGCDGGEGADRGFVPGSPAYDRLVRAMGQVCTLLAREMARDGEGATRLIDVNVCGAANPEDADLAARSVANSPLVKTAVAGHDANWGRIAMALGKSGARFDQSDVDISIMGIEVCRGGLALEFDEEEALRRFEEKEISIDVDLHAGESCTTIWTCDLTHDYISINADYRT